LEFTIDPSNNDFIMKNSPDDIARDRVEYSKDDYLPEVDFSDQKTIRDGLVASVFTKSKKWTYEHEWRFNDLNGPGIHSFEPHFLTGVILGCNCHIDEAMTKEVSSWIQNYEQKNGVKINKMKAEVSLDKFSLNIVPMIQ